MNNVFIKHNPIPRSQSLINEAQGLETLREALLQDAPIRIVEVFKVTGPKLHLEMIDTQTPSSDDYIQLGHGLAQLHQSTQSLFGLDYQNYIGLSPQLNTVSRDWGHFFFHNRLWAQVERLTWQRERDDFFQVLESKKRELLSFVNDHKPRARLVHGDLWSGNVLYDRTGPVLIDPAISYSDPECDLAMTQLFGSFPRAFYREYRSRIDWKTPDQVDKLHQVYNLYHLLNHANLFGSSYLASCRKTLKVIQDL